MKTPVAQRTPDVPLLVAEEIKKAPFTDVDCDAVKTAGVPLVTVVVPAEDTGVPTSHCLLVVSE
jgi:hypothetical protein